MTKIKGLLSPSKLWKSPKKSNSVIEQTLPSENEDSGPLTPTMVNSHRISQIRRGDAERIKLLSDDVSSPNRRLIEFFRAKGDAQLTDVEREGVLALIKQASENNESVLDLSLDDLANESNMSFSSDIQTPTIRRSQSPLRSSPSFSTLARQSPLHTPRYTPLYKRSQDSITANPSTPRGSSSTKRLKTSASQHFSIPTPYKTRSGSNLRADVSKFHFAQPTESSLARKTEPVTPNKPTFQPKQLSQSASVLNTLLNSSEKSGEISDKSTVPAAASPSVYSSSPPKAKTPKETDEKLVSEEKKPNTHSNGWSISTPVAEAPEKPDFHSAPVETTNEVKIPVISRETMSSSLKKTNKFHTSAHPYQPSKSSSLRQAVTMSPSKQSITTTEAAPAINKKPFDFGLTTSSAKKIAPPAGSPSKPLFSQSPTVAPKQTFQFNSVAVMKDNRRPEKTGAAHNGVSTLIGSFAFPTVLRDEAPSLSPAEEEKLRKFKQEFSF